MAVKSSFKNMSLCLLAICLVCSALLAGVYALTAEPIAAAAAAKNEAAIKEVLPETAVTIEEERTVDFEGASYSYNLAYDELGNTVGCAINVAPVGFGGPIVIKVGFDVNGCICNTKVLSQAETPGLGTKMCDQDNALLSSIQGRNSWEVEFKVKKDGGELDALTAATISSRAYYNAVARAYQAFAVAVGAKASADGVSGATTTDSASKESNAAQKGGKNEHQ